MELLDSGGCGRIRAWFVKILKSCLKSVCGGLIHLSDVRILMVCFCLFRTRMIFNPLKQGFPTFF
jgi:uncharacterized protein YfaT (DUF1175 family)